MQYPYSGSDDEHQEAEVAGEPSSIIQAPGENTLRKNFQVLQEQNLAKQQAQLAQQRAEQQRAHHHHQASGAANGAKHVPQQGPGHGLQGQPEKKERRRDSRKEDQPPPEPGPPARPYLPPRLPDGGSPNANNTPPGPPPQRPLPPPPANQEPAVPIGAFRREEGRKPSTPPNRDQRNSRLIQQEQNRQNQQRKPEDLDVIAAQLNELAASPRNNRQGGDRRAAGQRQSSVEDARRMGGNQLASASNGQGKTFVGQPQPHLDEEEADADNSSRYIKMILHKVA